MFEEIAKDFVFNKLQETHPELQMHDNRYQCRCQVCGDSKKSKFKMRLNYYPDTNTVNCFNCGFSGNALFYIAAIENKAIEEVKRDMLSEYGKITSKSLMTKTKKQVEKFNSLLEVNDINIIKAELDQYEDTLPDDILKYLESRKIFTAPFLARKFPFKWDAQNKRIVIPWIYNNTPIYYQSRVTTITRQQKYMFPPKHKVLFFNLDEIDINIPYLFICESALDSIFVKNCIASGSLRLTGLQKRLLSTFFPTHQLIYMPDNFYVDASAKEHISKLAMSQPMAKFFITPQFYRKYKDPNSAVIGTGINNYSDLDFLLQNTFSSAITLTKMMLK